MAITRGAKKAHRASLNKKIYNDRRRRAFRNASKDLIKQVNEGKDSKELETSLSLAYKAIDKAAKRGVLKPNTAARKKSKLARLIGGKKLIESQ